MPKCCGDNSPKEIRIMSEGPMILISYTHPNYGNHRVTGPVSGKYYGYYGGGGKNQFKVYESDAKARPDLFVPVAKKKEVLLAQKQAIEAQLAADEDLGDAVADLVEAQAEEEQLEVKVLTPVYSESSIDAPGSELLANLDYPQGISSRQIVALSDANIDTVDQFQAYLAEGGDLSDIDGIADASARKLSKMVRDYLAGA